MPSNTRFRVLSVDDDADAGEMMVLLLKPQQIDVICVQSAAEAWTKMDAEHFDLYLLDAWLPDLNGFELCRQIRGRDDRTPILFYSGAAYDADKQEAFAAGANAYVTKPDVDDLITTTLNLVAQVNIPDVQATWTYNLPQPDKRSSSRQLFSMATATD